MHNFGFEKKEVQILAYNNIHSEEDLKGIVKVLKKKPHDKKAKKQASIFIKTVRQSPAILNDKLIPYIITLRDIIIKQSIILFALIFYNKGFIKKKTFPRKVIKKLSIMFKQILNPILRLRRNV